MGYDWTKPADFIEKGGNDADLVDSPEKGTIPVFVYGYQYVCWLPRQIPFSHCKQATVQSVNPSKKSGRSTANLGEFGHSSPVSAEYRPLQ